FGIALVAGRKRVPSPATGKTALRRSFMRWRGLRINTTLVGGSHLILHPGGGRQRDEEQAAMRWSPSRLQAQERSRPNRDARGKTEDGAAWLRGAVGSRRHYLAASYCCYVNPCRRRRLIVR